MVRGRTICAAALLIGLVAPATGSSGPATSFFLDCDSPTLSDDATFSDDGECFDVSQTPFGDEIYDPATDELFVPEFDGPDSVDLKPPIPR